MAEYHVTAGYQDPDSCLLLSPRRSQGVRRSSGSCSGEENSRKNVVLSYVVNTYCKIYMSLNYQQLLLSCYINNLLYKNLRDHLCIHDKLVTSTTYSGSIAKCDHYRELHSTPEPPEHTRETPEPPKPPELAGVLHDKCVFLMKAMTLQMSTIECEGLSGTSNHA